MMMMIVTMMMIYPDLNREHHEVGWSPLRNHPINVRGGQVSDWEESQVLAALAVMSYPRLCSDGALQTAIWENWAFTRVTLLNLGRDFIEIRLMSAASLQSLAVYYTSLVQT